MTVPLAAILGLCDTPGEVAAFGPVDADVTRDLIRAAGLHPATRWCVTVVGPDGQAIGHGCAHGRHRPPRSPPIAALIRPAPAAAPRAAVTAAPGPRRQPPRNGGSSPPGGGDARPAAAVPAATGRPATAVAALRWR